jgi:hypothetical protein
MHIHGFAPSVTESNLQGGKNKEKWTLFLPIQRYDETLAYKKGLTSI